MSRTTEKRWPRRVVAVFALAVLAAGGGAGAATYALWSSGTSGASSGQAQASVDPDTAAIRAVIVGGLHATLEVPSHQSIAKASAQGMSGSDWVTAGKATFAQYYAGEPLQRKSDQLARITSEFGSTRSQTDSEGVSSVDVQNIVVEGDTATATAEDQEWAKTAVPQADGSTKITTANDVVDSTFHLTKINGRWLIDKETSAFAPGKGP